MDPDGFWPGVRAFIENNAEWAGEWLLIPALFVFIIYVADAVVRKATKGGDHEISVRAGYWAGFIGLVVFITAVDEDIVASFIPFEGAPGLGLSMSFFVLGAVWGSVLVYVLKRLIPTQIGGLVVGVIVFLGSASLFTYVVYHDTGFDEILRWWTLGHAFGILILTSVSPRQVREFFPERFNPFEGGADESRPDSEMEETPAKRVIPPKAG